MSQITQILKQITQIVILASSLQFPVSLCLAQEPVKPTEYTLDVSGVTTPTPKIFSVGLNLTRPDPTSIEKMEKELGLSGTYRIKWDFWDIGHLDIDKDKQKELIGNYEALIKKISERGGTVIVTLIYTPPGLGRTLDRRSMPQDVSKWRELAKEAIRVLSCEKKYNVWYEVWDDPANEEIFLGSEDDYLELYRAIARSVLELEKQYNIHIPVGGPSAGRWYDNFETNTALTPERSLIYDLMRFCSQNSLPLDFISWKAFSTEASAENQAAAYNRTLPKLIKEWLSYFGLKQEVALVMDAWNWGIDDRKFLDERQVYSYIAASFIPARLKNMNEAGLDRAVFYSLQDQQDEKGNPVNNFGMLIVQEKHNRKEVSARATYSVYRFLSLLGNEFFPALSAGDGSVGGLATKRNSDVALLFWHYSDPYLVRNQLERVFISLSGKEQNTLLEIIKSNRLKDLLNKKITAGELTDSDKLKRSLEELAQLYEKAEQSKSHRISLTLKNIKGWYQYRRYAVDEICAKHCEFRPVEQKAVNITGDYIETVNIEPYSVVFITLDKATEDKK